MYQSSLNGWSRFAVCVGLVALLAIGCTVAASAQQASTAVPANSAAVAALMQRVEELEAQVQDLKSQVRQLTVANGGVPVPSAPAEAASSGSASAAQASQIDTSQQEAGHLNTARLQIHGFGDVGWNGSDLHGATNSFALGQLNLFITSRLNDQMSFLTETVIEADPGSNQFGIEPERLLLLYNVNDRLNLSFGRYHTGIGFYNTAYHHSALMQTAIGRPFLFDFEDHGGILPIHNVGVSATGIVSTRLGLHYVAEIGNGRSARTALGDNPVQNVTDEHNGKAFNFALLMRPDALPGWQFGASGYHDHLTPITLVAGVPVAVPDVSENILSGHVIFQNSRFEFMNEAVVLQHAPDHSSLTTNIPGFYSQISRRFGSYRPYFRYEYVNVPQSDLLYADVGLRHGPIAGIRYDVNEMSAFKLQFGRTMQRNQDPFNSLQAQFAFAF